MTPANGHHHPSKIEQTLSPRPVVPTGVELPHDIESEASVIGGVMLRNELLRLLDTLRTDDFYLPQHRVVWEAVRNLEASGKAIDVVMLGDQIERAGRLDSIGGFAFLGELALRVPTVDNVRAYADIVRTHSRNRQAILAFSSMAYRALNWQHDPAELVAELRGELGRLEDLAKPPAKRLKLISIAQSIEDMAQLARAPVFPTPFPALNKSIGFGGVKGTQVYVLAAGTGRGKTSFVIHLGAHVAEHGSFTVEDGEIRYEDTPVLVVSYEMKPGYFVARKAAGVIGCHSNSIISGEIDAGTVMRAMPYPRMFFMHRPSLAEVREAVEWLKAKFGRAPLVIVDYIQKLADQIAAAMPRPDLRLATSEASAVLCDIAEKTDAAIIAVSAIGRGKGKILANPRKEAPYDLVEVAKESGAVEFDSAALIVLSLHKEYDGDDRIATITCAKTRFGSECHIDARFNGARGSWRSLERVELDDGPAAAAKKVEELKAAADDLRSKVLAIIEKAGSVPNKAAVFKVLGGNKQKVYAAIAEMLQPGLGLLVKNASLPGDGIVIAGGPHDPASQTQVELPTTEGGAE